MRGLRRLRWLLLVPGIISFVLFLSREDWPMWALFAVLGALPWAFVQVETMIARWHERRVLDGMRSGIKRVRGRSVIPRS